MRDYERCTLLEIEYKTHSVNGNPSYYVAFLDSEGHYKRGYTASDSSSGYTIKNYRYAVEEKPVIYLDYHFTQKKGTLIVDSIRDNTPEEAKKRYLAEVELSI